MYKFGTTSKERLATCHDDLQKIMESAIALSPIDFGIACGHRSIADQQKAFNEGKSKIDGITKKGKHNYSPSLAVDVYAFVNGKASWDAKELCVIAGVVLAVAANYGIKLRWGGNWDMDSQIISDQSFQDLPHFELI
jgi:peptidoglycan L-alanyl-D-glutamate endopeptidase CwlK